MTLLWSANFVVVKFVLREIPALLVIGLRMTLAALCMLLVYGNRPRRIERNDLPKLLLLGILGIGLNQVLFVVGLSRTSVAHAAILIGLTPVTVLLLAALMGQERLSPARLAGMFIALAGVLLLQVNAGESRVHTLLGDVLVFSGSSMFALFTVAGKSLSQHIGSVAVNTIGYTASAVLLLPLTLSMASEFDFSRVSWIGWSSLLYTAVFASALCYIIYYYALSHVPASRVAAFSYVQPLLATLMAIPMLGERPTGSLIAGGALVFAGVLLAERA